LFLNILCNY